MSNLYDIEQWRQRHRDLLREADEARLARRLRPARLGRFLRAKNTLLKSPLSWLPRKRATAEC